MSGKGDKRRKGADDNKYRKGWDLIWGNQDNNKKNKNGQSKQENTEIGTVTRGNSRKHL